MRNSCHIADEGKVPLRLPNLSVLLSTISTSPLTIHRWIESRCDALKGWIGSARSAWGIQIEPLINTIAKSRLNRRAERDFQRAFLALNETKMREFQFWRMLFGCITSLPVSIVLRKLYHYCVDQYLVVRQFRTPCTADGRV